MASVWHASGICTDARRAGEALTLRGESGVVSRLQSESQFYHSSASRLAESIRDPFYRRNQTCPAIFKLRAHKILHMLPQKLHL